MEALLEGRGELACNRTTRFVGDQFRFHGFQTLHQPWHREKIRFLNADGRLKNQLDREVPELAAEAVFQLFQNKSATPDRLVVHTGGRDVILAIEDRIPAHHLYETLAVLRDHGNISSPSVLAALEKSLAKHPEARRIWLTAFGAGFSAHARELARE